MAQNKGLLINILCLIGAAGAFQTFLTLSLAFFKADWHIGVYLAVLIGATLLNILLCTAEILLYDKKKEIFYKSIITAYVLLIFAAVVFYILLKTDFLEIVQNEESLKAYLEQAGVWMGVLFVLLQFLQVVVLPIPSFVTVAAGTALFGPLRCALYSLAGILLGSITAFLIGRYVGHRAVAWLIGEETLEKWLKKIKGRDKLFLSAMFLLPIFPDDVLCFIAGISSMSFLFFVTVIVVSRVIAIFTTCYSITLIPFNTWWGVTLWALFFVGVVVLFVVLYKKADAIQAWFDKKFHAETRLKKKKEKEEFSVEIVSPDGILVEKGVPKEGKASQGKNLPQK